MPAGLCPPSSTTRGELATTSRRPGHRVAARPARTASGGASPSACAAATASAALAGWKEPASGTGSADWAKPGPRTSSSEPSQPRERRQDPELGGLPHARANGRQGGLDGFQGGGELVLRDGHTVDLDALGTGLQVRAGHGPGAQPLHGQDGSQERAGGALAAGARDQRAAQTGFGMPELGQQGPGPLQPHLDPEAAGSRDPGHGRVKRGQDVRVSSAASVLAISIARVISPTPPGTGVTQPATSATPGSTSPPTLPSMGVTPTSITTAPGLPMSGFTI